MRPDGHDANAQLSAPKQFCFGQFRVYPYTLSSVQLSLEQHAKDMAVSNVVGGADRVILS